MTDSSEKPEGFEEILKEIQISFENNNDAVVQERVFKNAFNYVRKNTPKRHWFCDKYMFPVVIHLMIVFSFPPSEISKWIRLRIEESCENCQLCTIQYHKGKITLKEQLTYDKKIPMKQVNEFMKVIDVWESESAEANLEPFLNQELTLSILPTKLMFGIMSCLLNPNILRINQKLNLDLKAVFTKVPQTSLPEPTLLVPGIVYFLFEGSLEEKQWAKLTCKTISEIPVEQRELATMPPFLEEFKIWYYQIQDAKSFSISNCIKFWDVFLLVEPSVDTSILIGEMNSPKDLELQSISQNLRLYPLSRVLLNHLMSNLKEPLPVLLKVVAVYLKRLSEEFWTIVQPFTFINVLDRVLNDPNFALYLDTFLPKPSSSNGSLYNLIDWMSIFSNTLSGSQQQTAAVRISNYLLQRNLQNTESRKIIHELGCQLLSKSINNEDGIIGLKQFSMDLLKKRDCRAAIDNNAQLIVKLATIDKSNTSLELIKRSFNFDVTSLANHSINLQEGSVPTSFDVFPLLWSEVLKVPSLHSSVSLIMELLTSFKSVSGIMHFEPKKANPNVDKLFLSALAQHNRNANIVLGVLGKMLEKIALIDPSKLKSQAFNNDIVSVGYWSCVFQPQTSQSAIDILYLVFDDDEGTGTGRLEAIQALFKTSVKTTLLAINENLSTLVNMKCFEPCPKSVRILMDVIEALTDPLNGLLISHTLDSESQDQLKIFWQRSWLFLVMIYQGALTWANQYKIEKLIEFTRDTLDLSRKLLDSFMLVLDSTKSRSKEDSATLFKIFMHAFHYVIVWLRLGDVSLLNSCVDLVFKGFDLAKDLDISVDKDFLINFAKYGAKAKKFNNKLTENQRLEILGKAREFDDALVEKVVWEVQEQRQKSKAAEVAANKEALVQQQKLQLQQQQQQLKPIINVGSDSGAVYKYQTHIKQPRQQTLGRFGVVSKDAPIAPPPPQSFEPSSSLDAIRKSLQQSRTPGYKPPAAPIVAPAAPRPAGFNSKSVTVIGRSLNSLKKKKIDSDSSEEDEDDDTQDGGVDFSDLFVEKKKKIKVVEVDIMGRPVVRPGKSVAKQLSDKRREEEYMRLRLNVNLKPLYSTILKWNYNSKSEYPTKETDIYKPIKDTYEDAKDYIKTTEPLLMLECWQGIQSAKQTGQDLPFEILIGSRTSCDGFFDVFASIKKSILQERKIGDSDLLVLGHLDGLNIRTPQEAVKHLKDLKSITCLAKVREIKLANSDFSDITIRVYPQGSMMGVLTPKSVITGMKVMQMITIEREYSSLKGVQYYDLADDIFKAKPEKPYKIPENQVQEIQKTYGVNNSQAAAILGTFDREGFSLIQGPPGTGKTKTILGIVGYYLGKKAHKEGTISIESLKESTPLGGSGTNGTSGPKILVCAPSNAAVDELVIRLRNGVQDLKGEYITPRVVRMGRSDATNAAVRDLTLEELVDKQLLAKGANSSTSSDPQIREQHTKCIAERNKLRDEMQKENLEPDTIMKLEEEMRNVNKRKNELAKKLDEQRERVSIAYRTREIERRQLQAKILNEAQIICSTLSGSAHDFLSSLSIQFDQVIVDEACQCVELSAIIPLRYGCKKCIMVGDPNQLPPTVLSQTAASLNYEQSLFVRMQKRFPELVYLLDVQYRMHPDISQFPSREFYNSKLHDGSGMKEKNTRPWHDIYPLTPYRFFDVTGKHQQSVQSKSLFNHSEAQIVLELVEKVMDMLPPGQFNGKIGVISPYKEQIRVLKDIFRKKYGFSILNEIDFNTVDGYQGQEKDIIIMSCVRASPTGNVGFLSDIRRMNVALTRARTSLWVLGNQESLMRNKVWNHLLTNAAERNVVTKAYPGFLKQIIHNITPIGEHNNKKIENKSSFNSNTDPKPKETKSSVVPAEKRSISEVQPSRVGNLPKAKAISPIFQKSSLFTDTRKAPKPSKPTIHVANITRRNSNESGAESSIPGNLPKKPSNTFKPSNSGYRPPRPQETGDEKPTSTGNLPPKKRPQSSIFINNKRKRPPKH